MKANILAAAAELSDRDLLSRLDLLAARERGATAELVAHLAALDLRPAVYAAQGYGSLFSYCVQALRLSEDAACNRIEAARACRRFPVILEGLASGSLSLTCVRLLGRYFTVQNHQAVLSRAAGRSRPQIEALLAELAPRPDVSSSVRKLPSFAPPPASTRATQASVSEPFEPALSLTAPPPAPVSALRPIVQASAPERYRVQFTIGQQTHEKLKRLQALLRREIPNGDPGVIFDRALDLLLEKIEKTRLGGGGQPPRPPIRPRTDTKTVRLAFHSRYVARAVRRAVWRRDGGQCAFVAPDGRRCSEQTFLELHHIHPLAKQGPGTVENISLRCRRHNQYEAELIFGPKPHRTPVSRVGLPPATVSQGID